MGNANGTTLRDTKFINSQHLTEEECFKEHQNLIWHVVHRYQWAFKNSVIDQDDLFSEGAIALLKAYRRFKEYQGVKFSTYAVPLIDGYIKQYLRDYYHPVKYPRHMRNFEEDNTYKDNVLSFNMTIFYSPEGDDITLEQKLYDEDDYTDMYLNDRLNDMPKRTKQMVMMRLNGMNQTEIGEKFNLSQVQVSRLIKKEIDKPLTNSEVKTRRDWF